MRQRHEIPNWGKSALVLSTDCTGEPGDPDNGGAGMATWTFQRADLRRLRLRDYCAEDTTRGGDVRRSSQSLADSLRGEGYDDGESDEIQVSDPDTAIRLLAIMRTKPGTFHVDYSADGSEYWAWHDIGHAEHDCEIGSVWRKGQTGTDGKQSDGRRGVQIYVDGEAESRALVRGARESVRRGVPFAEIVRELATVAKDFAERFEYPDDALAVFLAGCTVRLTPGYGDEPATPVETVGSL